MKRLLVVIVFVILGYSSFGQTEKEKKWLLRGYVKELATLSFAEDSVVFDNLIHNRLNFKWWPTDQLNVIVQARNRLFFGKTVKSYPNYGELVDVNNDYLDLSLMGESDGIVVHSMIDRAYLEWYKGDWEVRVGRQRINWGINTVWNPNDLFNTYSFFDFDYEERPGSDAIRIKKYTGVAGNVEFAINVADDIDNLVAASLWRFNKWNYDFQFIAGKAGEDLAIGTGWAGNINTAGFKGEITVFNNYNSNQTDLVGSIALDYSFENSIYINGSFLYNTAAPINPDPTEGVNLFTSTRLTAKDLSPFRYATLGQVSYNLHPLITGSFAAIYYPSDRNALFINPSLTYSIVQNLDLNLISQIYFDRFTLDYKAQAKLLFIRIKWSF